jgi:hypothetical protein
MIASYHFQVGWLEFGSRKKELFYCNVILIVANPFPTNIFLG